MPFPQSAKLTPFVVGCVTFFPTSSLFSAEYRKAIPVVGIVTLFILNVELTTLFFSKPLFFSKTLKAPGWEKNGLEVQVRPASLAFEDATEVSVSDASQDARQDAIRKVRRAVSSQKGSQKEGPESGG